MQHHQAWGLGQFVIKCCQPIWRPFTFWTPIPSSGERFISKSDFQGRDSVVYGGKKKLVSWQGRGIGVWKMFINPRRFSMSWIFMIAPFATYGKPRRDQPTSSNHIKILSPCGSSFLPFCFIKWKLPKRNSSAWKGEVIGKSKKKILFHRLMPGHVLNNNTQSRKGTVVVFV